MHARLADAEVRASRREAHRWRGDRRHESSRRSTLLVERDEHLTTPRTIGHEPADNERDIRPPLVIARHDVEVVPLAPGRVATRARRWEVEVIDVVAQFRGRWITPAAIEVIVVPSPSRELRGRTNRARQRRNLAGGF